MRRWRTWPLLLAMATALGCLLPTPAHAVDFKVGADQVQLSGATYTHDNGTTKLTNSGSMSATQFTLEFLPTQNFGLEFAYALSPLERSYQLGAQGATSQNVTEQASYSTIGANMYLFREEREGLHPVVGVATGMVSVSQKFEGGTLGTVSTSDTVNINLAKAGLEWTVNKAGFRLQYQLWSGQATNATKIPGIRQTNDYTGSAISLGVFSYF